MAIVVQSRVLLEKLWVLYTPSFGVIICFLARGCWLGLSFELYRFARWSLYELDLLRDVPWMCNYFRFDWVSNWHEKCWADKSHNRTLVYIKRQWCLIVFQLSASTHWCLVPFWHWHRWCHGKKELFQLLSIWVTYLFTIFGSDWVSASSLLTS